MKRVIILYAAALLFPILALAAELTEQDAVKIAINNSPALEAARQMYVSVAMSAMKTWWLPNPMAGFEFMEMRDNALDVNTASMTNIIVEQKIPFPAKYIWAIGASNARTDYYKYMYLAKKKETVRDVLNAYYSVYKIRKEKQLLLESSGILKQVSDIAFAKYNSGIGTQQDALKADVEYGLMRDELNAVENSEVSAFARLRAVIGDENFFTKGDGIADPELPELKMEFDAVKELVIKNDPEINAAAAAYTEADNMKIMSIAEFLPDFGIKYSKRVNPGSSEYTLMLEAEVPVWFLSNQVPNIAEKMSMVESRKKEFNNGINLAVAVAREHYEEAKSHMRTLLLYRDKLIPQSEAALKSMMAGYKSKKTDFMALLDTERMLLEMKKDYYMHETEYLMHYRMLEEMTGGLK